jgi:hypothetical protein
MPVYEVETDRGTYELEIDRELDDSPASHQLLQRLVAEQLRQQQSAQNTPGSLATQALGGLRDAAQSVLDLPAQIGNVITEFLSPDPPGGARRRVVPEVQAPQLPDVSPPQTTAEKATRLGSQVAADLAGTLVLPGIREKAARVLLGERAPVKPSALMFEPHTLAARGGTGTRPVKTLARPSGVLLEELSTPAQNLAELLGLPKTTQSIKHMSQSEASAALQQIMRTLGKDFNLTQMQGPTKELWEAIEQQLLRYR